VSGLSAAGKLGRTPQFGCACRVCSEELGAEPWWMPGHYALVECSRCRSWHPAHFAPPASSSGLVDALRNRFAGFRVRRVYATAWQPDWRLHAACASVRHLAPMGRRGSSAGAKRLTWDG
jgi:hypothetical protein